MSKIAIYGTGIISKEVCDMFNNWSLEKNEIVYFVKTKKQIDDEKTGGGTLLYPLMK